MNVAFSLWPTRANGQHRRVWLTLGPGNFISRLFISTGSEARDEGGDALVVELPDGGPDRVFGNNSWERMV